MGVVDVSGRRELGGTVDACGGMRRIGMQLM